VHVVGSGVEQDFDVQWARPHDGAYLMKLAGLDAPEPAAPLRGATVFVERTLLPPLEPGEYYLSDLVGALVLCAGEDGPRELGRIEAVRSYETVDSAVVVTPDGRRLEQPLVEPFLAEVDIAERRVVLATLDGLID
jgi:16S rRNA processing protein RimM